jgi:DNA-directed RNA polymerase specialized sigma24 family protein
VGFDFSTDDTHTLLAANTTPEQRRAAAVKIASDAHDAADADQLLQALGLKPYAEQERPKPRTIGLPQITPEQRRRIRTLRLDGHTYPQIAELVGVSVSTAKYHAARAS